MIDTTANQLLKKLKQEYQVKAYYKDQITDYCENYWNTEVYSYNIESRKYHMDYIEADLHIDYEEKEILGFLDSILCDERIEDCTIEILDNPDTKQNEQEHCICKDDIEEIELKTKDGWFIMDDKPNYCPYCGRKLSIINNDDDVDIGETLEHHANL